MSRSLISPILFYTLIALFFSMAFPISAQEEQDRKQNKPENISYHSLGDQVFSINAGLFIPLFFADPSPAEDQKRTAKTNLSLGGEGSLYYGAYLNNNVQLGLEVGAMFAQSPNKNNFYMIPISVRATYEIQLKNNLFTIPLFLGFGMNMTSYQDDFHIDMLLKPGVGFMWNYSANWSFGSNVSYWWVPQFYPSHPEYNRFGNFMDVNLSATYHF